MQISSMWENKGILFYSMQETVAVKRWVHQQDQCLNPNSQTQYNQGRPSSSTKNQKTKTLGNGSSRPCSKVYMHKWRPTWWKNNSKFKNQQPTLACKLPWHAMLHAAVAASQARVGIWLTAQRARRRGKSKTASIVMWGPLKTRARPEKCSPAHGLREKKKLLRPDWFFIHRGGERKNPNQPSI